MKTVDREIRSIMVSSSKRKDGVQSHTVQSEFQDVRNGILAMITSGKDTAQWADACIGSEIRPTSRAPNKMASPVMVISSPSPFAGSLETKSGNEMGDRRRRRDHQTCLAILCDPLGPHT